MEYKKKDPAYKKATKEIYEQIANRDIKNMCHLQILQKQKRVPKCIFKKNFMLLLILRKKLTRRIFFFRYSYCFSFLLFASLFILISPKKKHDLLQTVITIEMYTSLMKSNMRQSENSEFSNLSSKFNLMLYEYEASKQNSEF